MKRIERITKGMIVTFGLFYWISDLYGSPMQDLSSPSQETRDAAAKVLQKTYSPPPRTNWDALVSALKIGTPQVMIEKQIQFSNLVLIGGIGSGNTEVKSYRLDDLWVLDCSFTNITANITNGGLAHVTLKKQLRNIWVEPPTNFTGLWKTYWVNGQPSHEFHYENGHPEGMLTTFHNNGSKSVISPQCNGVPDGEEMGFYPSGQTAYKGTYKAGIQVGQWVWYNEDGSVQSKHDYLKGAKKD